VSLDLNLNPTLLPKLGLNPKQAEAERERRAVIINSEGEMLAADNLVKAAQNLVSTKGALHLRTLHTINASKTVDRVIEVFPHEEQAQIRNTLATSLKLVVAQNLFKRIDKKGRCAALEIMVCTSAISNLIRDNKTFQIPSIIQTGKKQGMVALDDAIMEQLNKKWISPEEAFDKCVDKAKFLPFLKETPPDYFG